MDVNVFNFLVDWFVLDYVDVIVDGMVGSDDMWLGYVDVDGIKIIV